MIAAFMLGTITADWNTQTLLDGKIIFNFMHSQVMGHAKTSIFPSSLSLVAHTSHLMKLSPPNIYVKLSSGYG